MLINIEFINQNNLSRGCVTLSQTSEIRLSDKSIVSYDLVEIVSVNKFSFYQHNFTVEFFHLLNAHTDFIIEYSLLLLYSIIVLIQQ